MRPRKLTICGWGPYKEENHIDFTDFENRGLFLITGQTGAGKTTIFDAIMYALYGVMSGENREKGSVRSDFADENTKTYVELTMLHRGEAYQLLRNPEYLRPKKRKNGKSDSTKEKENAVLTMPDGTIIAGNNDVTAKVEEILHMDARQFKQISMIAQGEFSRLIFAPSKDKTTIFREIFSTGIYQELQSTLSERAKTLAQQYDVYSSKMEENIHMLHLEEEAWQELIQTAPVDFEKAEQLLDTIYQEKKTCFLQEKKRTEKLDQEIFSLHEKWMGIQQNNKIFADYDKACEREKGLEEKRKEEIDWNSRLKKAQKALTLSYEEEKGKQQEQALTALREKQKKTLESRKRIREELTGLEKTADYREEIEKGYMLLDKMTEYEEEKKKQQKQYEILLKELKHFQDEYVTLSDKMEKFRRIYEEADLKYRRGVIGIAARMLQEGQPCPVCGSIEHPHVAEISEDVPDEEKLSRFKEQFEKSREECNQLFSLTLQKKTEGEEKEKQLRQQEQAIEELNRDYGALPEGAREFLKNPLNRQRVVFQQAMERYQEYQGKVLELEKQEQELATEIQEAAAGLKTVKEQFQVQLKKAGFAGEEEYHRALLGEKEMTALQSSIVEFGKEEAALKELVSHLKESLRGKKRVDETPFVTQQEEKQQEKKQAEQQLRGLSAALEQIRNSKKSIHENRTEAEEISEQYGIWKDLDNLANGKNARRLVFEQYVLAGYFEQILVAANKRLRIMTDGRFEMHRAGQMSDGRTKDNLEITVMDYYTGKERSVKTLSGGETFKASLALALGMSDCIQAENGGVLVETLFIDEGFGALDEESLDQACSTLQSLAQRSRMIGIISHVPELRERIENQIVVEKRNSGSFILTK